MTKNPYTPQLHSTIHANVSITTEEECHPVLLLPNSIHIEKLIIQETKSFCKFDYLLFIFEINHFVFSTKYYS
jgi:hypothetical protein